jgi:outer membrane protein insertion porin family
MRFFLVLAPILTLFSVYAYAGADVISNVSIEGLQNVNSRSVLSVAKLKKGKYYSGVAAREDMRSILETDYFDNVEVHFDDISGNLTFVVEEKPYIECIVFNGNSEFSDGILKKESVLKEKKYYDFSKLEETKKKIDALYRNKGYGDCNIEVYPTTDANTNKMTITFLIIENNRTVIEEVKVEGMIFFKEKEILKLMRTKPGKMFNEDTYKTDLNSVETFYKDNGFIDYKFVSLSVVHNDARTKMFLTLNISEGSRYKIGSITCDGNSTAYNKEIEKIIRFKKGQIFNQSKITEIISNGIRKFYYDRGYLNAEVVPCFNKDADGGIVNVNLSVKEGSVFYVGNIYIDGLVLTRDKVIRRELLIKPGEVLTNENLRRSIEKIYNLGFVNDFKYQVLATDKPGIVDIMISITEGDFGVVSGGVGYSLDDKLIATTQIQRMNIFGLGQKLSLNLSKGLYKKRLNYEVDWAEPWIFDKNVSLGFNVFNIKKSKDKDYDAKECGKNRIGFMAKVGPRLNDYMSLLFGYAYEYVNLSPTKEKIEETSEIDKVKTLESLDLKKTIKTSSVFAQFVYDSRNYIFDPSRGSIHIANLTLASNFLGGDVNFLKGTVKSTWFFPTFWKFVLSINLQSGVIIPYGQFQLSVPTYDRFYLGGSNTIRGYAFRTEIGAINGGTVMGLMNIEYKFPMFFNEGKEFIQGIMFYDIGGNWENYNSISLVLGDEVENIRSCIGFGIKIMIPVFPLRIEWGYGLNHKRDESRSQFYFSFRGN